MIRMVIFWYLSVGLSVMAMELWDPVRVAQLREGDRPHMRSVVAVYMLMLLLWPFYVLKD